MRYIDADKLIKKIFPIGLIDDDNYTINAKAVKIAIDKIPTEDVVPKSEVDRLVDKWIGEEKLTQDEKTLRLIEALQDEAKRYERYYFNHEYDKLIAEAKQEVAREIFEELDERFVWTDGDYYMSFPYFVYAELKKKYTESEGEHGRGSNIQPSS